MMVSGPNLNETSIVSGGYGGTAEGIIPTGTIKGTGATFGGSGSIVGQRGQLPSVPLTHDTRLCHGLARVSPGGAWVLCGGSVWGCVLMAEQGLLPQLPSPWAGLLPYHWVGSLLGISIPLVRTSLWD